MERPRVLHIFLRSCQQELNNIIYLRIQIYMFVRPLKPDLEFSLGTGGDGRILGWRCVLRTKYANGGASLNAFPIFEFFSLRFLAGCR